MSHNQRALRNNTDSQEILGRYRNWSVQNPVLSSSISWSIKKESQRHLLWLHLSSFKLHVKELSYLVILILYSSSFSISSNKSPSEIIIDAWFLNRNDAQERHLCLLTNRHISGPFQCICYIEPICDIFDQFHREESPLTLYSRQNCTNNRMP